VRRAAGADRGTCLVYDPRQDVLWTVLDGVYQQSAGDLPLARRLLDGEVVGDEELRATVDPEEVWPGIGSPGAGPFLAVPVHLEEGELAGVLAATREPGGDRFNADDEAALNQLASLLARRLADAAGARTAVLDAAEEAERETSGEGQAGPFRQAALERRSRGLRVRQDPLRLDPTWGRTVYLLLVVAFFAAILYSLLGRIDEYATGVAIVELPGRTNVTALEAGTVTSVAVTPGEGVSEGQLLLQLDDGAERAELARLDNELRVQLVRRLRAPSDAAVEQVVIAVRLERDLAAAQLAARRLLAPQDGVVSDVWVREGQYVQPGQPMAALGGGTSLPTLTILLPGYYRPALEPGMAVRFEVSGYRYAYQHLTIDAVGDEVVGPGEAQRYLGAAQAGAVDLSGPVVVAEATLPATFEAEGGVYRYHSGMQGQAEVRLRSEPLLLTLVPALKALTEGGDD